MFDVLHRVSWSSNFGKVKSISEFGTNELVAAVSHALHAINEQVWSLTRWSCAILPLLIVCSTASPRSWPMATRLACASVTNYRLPSRCVATSFLWTTRDQSAHVLQELGYTGEKGYQTFLYPNEKARKEQGAARAPVHMWLAGHAQAAYVADRQTAEGVGGRGSA